MYPVVSWTKYLDSNLKHFINMIIDVVLITFLQFKSNDTKTKSINRIFKMQLIFILVPSALNLA